MSENLIIESSLKKAVLNHTINGIKTVGPMEMSNSSTIYQGKLVLGRNKEGTRTPFFITTREFYVLITQKPSMAKEK